MAKAVKVNQMLSHLVVKLMAVKEVLVWWINSGIICGEIRTNSKIAVESVSTNALFLGSKLFLVVDIRKTRQNYSDFCYMFVGRKANRVTP